MRIAIELNDTAAIIHDGKEIISISPGYIVETGGHTWYGHQARERAFLYSNQCDNRFWSELASADENHIDHGLLKFAAGHLAFMWNQAPDQVTAVVLIVPATFTKTGLGLLLGICKQLNIPVQAMVHRAVLCPRQQGHEGDTVHIDMQLHHTAITTLKTVDQDFVVNDTRVVHGTGLVRLYQQVADYLAQEFIKNTRLDPMHTAKLEQQLFDRLAGWLQESWDKDSVKCELFYNDDSYEIMANSQSLHAVYQTSLDKIIKSIKEVCAGNNIITCATAPLDAEFGIISYLDKHHLKVRILDQAYFARRSLEYNEDILSSDGQVYLNKQLPYTQVSDGLADTVSIEDEYEKPDGVLFRHQAYKLKDAIALINRNDACELDYQCVDTDMTLLVIRNSDSDVSIEHNRQQAITINGQHAPSPSRLAIGDLVKVPGCDDVLSLIKVRE